MILDNVMISFYSDFQFIKVVELKAMTGKKSLKKGSSLY